MGGPGDVPHAPVFRLYHPFPNESRRPRAATRALGDACPSVRKPRPPPPPRPARQGELRASPSLSPLSVKPQPPARLLRSGLRLPSKCSYRTPLPTSPPPPETHALGRLRPQHRRPASGRPGDSPAGAQARPPPVSAAPGAPRLVFFRVSAPPERGRLRRREGGPSPEAGHLRKRLPPAPNPHRRELIPAPAPP